MGVAYCVQPVGDIETYSGYPKTTNYITLTSNTFTTTRSSPPPKLPLPSATSTSLLPHASGTLENCYMYKNYRDIPPILDQSQSDTLPLFTSFINWCSYIQSTFAVTVEDLIKWNPSLNPNNCTMEAGFSYCVLQDSNYKPSRFLSRVLPFNTLTLGLDVTTYVSTCMVQVDASKIPAGTDPTYSCFAEVFSIDYPDFGNMSLPPTHIEF